jgi:nucleotide sugar dehydrogenase
MKIAVIGTGYVGLVSGTCFAETGNDVTCVDIDHEKIKKLASGQVTIYEPGLEKLFLRNQKEDRLHFTTSLEEGIRGAKIIILALPTPTGGNGNADLKYVLKVAHDLGPLLNKEQYTVIIDKSTVPVGTAEKVREMIMKTGLQSVEKNAEQKFAASFDVVSNPEFLREGGAVEDFMRPTRVVIGSTSEKARKIVGDLYSPFVRQGNPIIYMDEKSAELTKYAANSFLATKISFMNEIAQLCERTGADVDMIRKGIGSDDRIGRRFLFSGMGYGGSCFPKDVKALSQSAQEMDYDFKILEAVMKVNEKQKLHLLPKIKSFFKNDLANKRIAVWGLAFKPNTDDIREAPALALISSLIEAGATISSFDPEAMANVKLEMGDKIEYAANQYEALKDADALVIATEWSEFRTPDFAKMHSLLRNKVIFDGRNLFDLDRMQESGFYYESVGRKVIKPGD